MKKIIALALSLIMVLSLSVSAFAAAPEYQGSTAPSIPAQNVTATYQGGDEAAVLYAVDVAWDLSFTYTAGKVWNPETHEDVDEDGSWTDANGYIRVTNHSNAAITATAAFDAADGYDDYITVDTAVKNLVAANAEDGASEVEISATANDEKALAESAQAVILGTVTVTIAAVNAGN